MAILAQQFRKIVKHIFSQEMSGQMLLLKSKISSSINLSSVKYNVINLNIYISTNIFF